MQLKYRNLVHGHPRFSGAGFTVGGGGGGGGAAPGLVATEYNFVGQEASGAPDFGVAESGGGPLALSSVMTSGNGSTIDSGYDRSGLGTPTPASEWTGAAPQLMLKSEDEFGAALPTEGFKMEAHIASTSSGDSLLVDFIVANGLDPQWYYTSGDDCLAIRWKWNTAGGALRHPCYLFASTDNGYAQPTAAQEQTPFRTVDYWRRLRATLDTEARTVTMVEHQLGVGTDEALLLHTQVMNINAEYVFPSFDYFGIWTPNHSAYEPVRIHDFWIGNLDDDFPEDRHLVA